MMRLLLPDFDQVFFYDRKWSTCANLYGSQPVRSVGTCARYWAGFVSWGGAWS
jgi:hypothetical protein